MSPPAPQAYHFILKERANDMSQDNTFSKLSSFTTDLHVYIR